MNFEHLNLYNRSIILAQQTRIVNGTDATEGEFPYAVSLRRNSSHTCGGTILNEKFILTAAHCVCKNNRPQDNSLFSIQYGLLEITDKPENTINIKEINCHEFSSEKLINDAAVLELESPIPQGKWIPVKITNEFVTNEKQTGTIIGWGRLYHNGPLSKTLQKINVEIYDDESCGKKYNTLHHICFGVPIGGACNGDSGTALLVNGVQVGIASFITDICGTANIENPNVYSRISTYYDWIAQIAGL
ncbi:hypothetical protein NQ314_007987 [Rhamnusium bicolor]|uniref:Peptidase S1 domain-containing protein n=1 Tax=Rhamnusium bicolor TaxID=1586634 RepID=A0AAV8YHX1_9CUCU|nr:hypothetical protein NQ314_007987 [Rhamnusium bicolor]